MNQSYQELLAQLQAAADEQGALAKSLPAEDGKDDQAIQAAAAEGEEAGEGNENPEDEEGDEVEGGEGKPMAKSAVIDGEEVDVVDATEILKSLDARVGAQEETLAKALTTTIDTIKAQGEMIKSLNARIEKLSGMGAGRKTVLTVIEKPAAGSTETLAKSQQQEGMTGAEFMAKAEAAFKAQKITGLEFTTADVALRSGQPVPAEIIAKALS